MSPNSERQDAGVGQGLCLGGTCFGSFAELALSPSIKSCLSDRNRGCVGDGGRQGGGPGRLDKPAHTRQMFAQKNTGSRHANITGSLLPHTAGAPPAAPPGFASRCEEGLGVGLGGWGRSALHTCADPLPSTAQNSPFFANVTPKWARAWSVPHVGEREVIS